MAKKLTHGEFSERASGIHGGRYTYPNDDYNGKRNFIAIRCPKHGIFVQLAASHLKGHGCPKCAFELVADNSRYSFEEFVTISNEIHNHKYDYAKVRYVNNKTDICIRCHTHGEFWQSPSMHLSGQGCRKCADILRGVRSRHTFDIFKENANLIHNNRYEYSKVEYINSSTKVSIICPKHGVFEQRPNDHLMGHGCPICSGSFGEFRIRKFLTKQKIKFTPQMRFSECKDKKLLPFDFFLPVQNLVIEYDGIQHFEPVKYFGGVPAYIKNIKHDLIKTKFSAERGMKLLRISYVQFDNINNILNEELYGGVCGYI